MVRVERSCSRMKRPNRSVLARLRYSPRSMRDVIEVSGPFQPYPAGTPCSPYRGPGCLGALVGGAGFGVDVWRRAA